MKKVNIAMVRLLQFVVFVIFTFMTLSYFGAMVLVPLDIVVLISKLLSVAGVGTLYGALAAVPVVAYLAMLVYKTPGLLQLIMDIGLDIINSGKKHIEAFNNIVEEVKK